MEDNILKELQDKATWLEREYREICDTCHTIVNKYETGYGGDKVDEIVATFVDQQAARIATLEAENAALRKQSEPTTNSCPNCDAMAAENARLTTDRTRLAEYVQFMANFEVALMTESEAENNLLSLRNVARALLAELDKGEAE